jgi:hypothetical protein
VGSNGGGIAGTMYAKLPIAGRNSAAAISRDWKRSDSLRVKRAMRRNRIADASTTACSTSAFTYQSRLNSLRAPTCGVTNRWCHGLVSTTGHIASAYSTGSSVHGERPQANGTPCTSAKRSVSTQDAGAIASVPV